MKKPDKGWVHLTDEQLKGYAANPNKQSEESLELRRHMLECDKCSAKLAQLASVGIDNGERLVGH